VRINQLVADGTLSRETVTNAIEEALLAVEASQAGWLDEPCSRAFSKAVFNEAFRRLEAQRPLVLDEENRK